MCESPSPAAPRKFKVTSDGLTMTITLDENWLAKPFMKGVVANFARKLNQQAGAGHAMVTAEQLCAVSIDGADLTDLRTLATANASEVVPHGTQVVSLVFGPAAPLELKFSITSPDRPSFTIALDRKFQQKTFFDAVVAPYAAYYNRRRSPGETALDADALVEFRVDGVKPSGHLPGVARSGTALSLLGHHPAHCELFFSLASVEACRRPEPEALRFKVYVPTAAEMRVATEFDWERKQLSAADGIEIGRQIRMHAPFKELKRLYLAHNQLSDEGIGGLAAALNRKNTPDLKRLILSHNRITDAGIRALAKAWGTSASADAERAMPQLDMLMLDENWIKDAGAALLLEMAEGGALTANEVKLHGNHAISADARAALLPVPGSACKSHFNFEPPERNGPWATALGAGPVSPMPGGGIMDLNKT